MLKKTGIRSRRQIVFSARGRGFTHRQIEQIRALVSRHFDEGRTRLSERVCRALRWRQPNGRLKDMACREVLRRLDATGKIRLPPAKTKGGVWRGESKGASFEQSRRLIRNLDFAKLRVERVVDAKARLLWRTLVLRFHYLGSPRIVGKQLKYLVYSGRRPVACFGWADASWELRARDTWIGWTRTVRSKKRQFVINNTRFLILPWVRVQNLASHLLARIGHQVVEDWHASYGIKPVLLETFVDPRHFEGTSYRAANWLELGTTRGYSKSGAVHHNSQTPKTLFVYPIIRGARKFLTKARSRKCQ